MPESRWIVLLVALACAIACSARPAFPLGTDCELASQCVAPLVCRLGRCREECRSDRDCRAGLVCLRADGLGACELDGETCVRNSDCRNTLVCLNSRCANACNTDVDCPSGARCMADGSGAHGCRDTFMMRCEHNTDCGPVLICAPDGVCREQCHADRDCRDGTVCDRTLSPTLCVWPRDGGASMDAGGRDGAIDTGVDASTDASTTAMNDVFMSRDIGIDMALIDAFSPIDMALVDAFTAIDTGVDMGVDMGVDAAVITGPAPPSILVAGGQHTCAVSTAQLRCWGANASGQLGDTTTSPHIVAAAVSVIASSATVVSAGNGFTCASTSSAVYCWGENGLGQVGNGNTTTPQRTPLAISPSSATTIASGRDHACLLRGGVVSCWGDNSYGQLGDGTTVPRRAPTPTLALARPAVDLGAGGRETCAVLDDGRVQCWGENNNGELGNGTVNAVPNSTPQLVSSLNDAIEVVVGTANACARRVNGAVVCWGDNLFGELGDGSAATMRPLPGPVPTLPTAVELTAGLSHVCARASDGTVYCWGDNGFGQVGASFATSSQTTPRQVPGLAGTTEIGAGEAHTCVRTGAGLRCWGQNGQGQLGNGVTSALGSYMPQAVMWP